MKEDIYIRLRRHLDTFILGAPESEAILEILRIRFTPKEAEIALLLNQVPRELSVLAEASDMAMADFCSLLEQMVDKALVFRRTKVKDGTPVDLYSLLPTAVGLWETSFAKGERNPDTEKLAHHWRDYYLDGWGKSMFPGKLPFTRVIPVGKATDASRPEIYSYEKASDLINEQKDICVLHCPCRTAAELAGNGCGKPTETCLHFGDLAKFFVEKGYARRVSRKEALEILDMTEKAGLIHMVGNSKEMGVAMCSCCSCCCTQLRAIKEFSISEAMAPSRFRAEVDPEACALCETCEERCQLGAVSMGDDAAVVDADKCLGCGLCVSTCPTEAITLKEREDYTEPVDTTKDLGKTFVKGST